MATLEKIITVLLVSSWALFLVTVLSASASSSLYFAELTTPNSDTYLRAGMWGACSLGVDTGPRGNHGCTGSQGGYILSANLDVSTSGSGGPLSPTSARFELLGSHATGPLVSLLVSFLLVTTALGTWTYDVFGTDHDTLRITRPVTAGLVFLSCILSWVGWGFADHLATELQKGMDEYKRRDEHNEDYQVSKGSAAWVAFAGAFVITFTNLFVSMRWRRVQKQDDANARLEEKSQSSAV